MLTQQQIDLYHEQGFLVVENFLPRETVENLGRITAELVQSARDLDKTDAFFDLEPSHKKGVEARVRRLKHPNAQHKLFADISTHPDIMKAIEQLNGRPGVRFTHPQGKVNIKAAGYGSAVEWHQDWAGYPHTNDDLVSVTVPLDGATLENGPLLVIPGSHKGPMYDHHVDGVYRTSMDPERDGIDFSKAVPLLGGIGMVYFHHVRVIHGSALNRSKQDRRLLINQYAAVDAWPLMGIKDLDSFDSLIITGEKTIEPLMRAVPVRMPLPRAADFDGLYANQEKAKKRFFEVYEEPAEKTAEKAAATMN